VERVPAAHIHTAGNSPDTQQLVLLLEQNNLSASFASANGCSNTCASSANYDNFSHDSFSFSLHNRGF